MNIYTKKCKKCGGLYDFNECPFCKKGVYFKDENMGPFRKSIRNRINFQEKLTPVHKLPFNDLNSIHNLNIKEEIK